LRQGVGEPPLRDGFG